MRSVVSLGKYAALGVVFAVLLFGSGCKSSPKAKEPEPEGACTSAAQCEADQRCDEELGRCVPKCTADNQCPKNTGTRCDEETGVCVRAETCAVDASCGSSLNHEYCDGLTCTCIPDTSVQAEDSPHTGVCWRPARTCEPCESSVECGNGPRFATNSAECKVFKVGAEEAGVCLPRHGRRCPQGMLPADPNQYPDLGDVCIPQGGDCAKVGPCVENADCTDPDLPVCDPVRQICIPGCSFDPILLQTVGCAQGRVCHATPRGSDPSLLEKCETALAYGLGSCDFPCEGNAECAAVDPSFVCMDDGGGKRCRPQGCINDLECPSKGFGYAGYCDVPSGECVYDVCRLGVDPRKGCGSTATYLDCSAAFKCVGDEEDGVGGCVEMDCLDQGGAERACNRGNFCAGEPIRDLLTGVETGELVEVPSGLEPGACYPMDLDVWCRVGCNSGADCVGKGPTSYPGSPPVCDDFELEEDICFWGCEYEQECPADWHCSSAGYEMPCSGSGLGAGIQVCEEDADCADGSRCVEPILNGAPATHEPGREFKVCECTETGNCSAGFSCNAGIATAAKMPGEPRYEEVQARYCADSSPCGSKGSCEWTGATTGSGVPISFCLASPLSMPGVEATCPALAGNGLPVRQGRMPGDQYSCVFTSICQPGFTLITSPDPTQNYYLCEAL